MADEILAGGNAVQTGENAFSIDGSQTGELSLPENLSVTDAEFTFEGGDLVMTFPDGTVVTVEGYQDNPNPPTLVSSDGAEVGSDVISAMADAGAPADAGAGAGGFGFIQPEQAEVIQAASDRRGIAASANGEEVEQVAPYASGDRVWTVTLTITSAKSARPWKVRLAACNSTIAEIVGTRAVSPATGRTIGARGLNGSAIAEVDLPLRAVLVDVPMSIARLASLEPGSVIPVAVNRNVPLMTGNLTIAHGCVGELDDRVALELTQTFLSE